MHRRALLATLGGLTTGCVAAPRGIGSSPSPIARDADTDLRVTDLSVRSSTDRPSVKYVLEPSAFYSADAVERRRTDSEEPIVVVDVSEIERRSVRRAIETAAQQGEWRANSLPDGLADLVERVDFFTGLSTDETYTHLGLTLHRLHPDRPPAIEFGASVTDETVSSESPGAMELSLTNVGQDTQRIGSGTVPPFGMVTAEGRAGEFLLWREYADEGCVSFTDDGVIVCSIGVITDVEPGETIAREYEVLPPSTDVHPRYTAPPGPGDYRISEAVGYSVGSGAPGSTLSVEVDFTLR